MVKNLLLALFFVATPYVAKADTSQCDMLDNSTGLGILNNKQFKLNSDAPTEKSRCGEDSPEYAYFYLAPQHFHGGFNGVGDAFQATQQSQQPQFFGNVICDDYPVIWDSKVFTVKTSGINIKPKFYNFGSKIVISNPGIYLIKYSVLANASYAYCPNGSGSGQFDYYTMELRINDCPVKGSRYTQTLVPQTSSFGSSAYGLGEEVPDPDSSQLNGQVLACIPACACLELFNVSGFPIRLENEGGNNGVFASIFIKKISDLD
jgi:hypothetical protein